MTKAELWKAIEDYRCAGGRVEHAVLKEKLDAMLDDLLNTPQKPEPQPVIWQSWSDQYGYGYWDTKDEAILNSAEDFEPMPLYEREFMEYLRAEKKPIKLEDLHIGVSPLTGTIYMGTVSKRDQGAWASKADCTSKFIGALMDWTPPGTVRMVNDNHGNRYEVEVRKLAPERG